jgi:hypothetical protein
VLEFAPRSSGTTDWPFEPAVSTDVSGARYSAELIETITQRGLSVTAWVVYLYNHLAARMFPDLTIENVFGDRSGAQLCPANPVTREYVTTLTDAVLGHAPLAGLVVESLSYLPYDYGFLNLKSAVTPSQAAALLLSVCFCSHCRARFSAADVDVNDLRHQVAAVLEKEFAALPDGFDRAGTEAWCEQSEQLQRVFAVRTEVASSLQQGVLRTARNIGLRTDTNSAGAHDGRITGMTSAAGEQLRSDYRFEVHPDWTTAQSQRAVTDAAAAAGPAATVYALAQLSNFPDETSFITSLEAVASHGIEHFRLYEYGLLSERHLSWLRNARHLWTVPGSGPTVSATEGME